MRDDCRGAPEIWGGVECSVVRLGNGWRDQLRETGHHDRESDLDLIAALGIRTIRYPLVWERVCTPGIGWDWHDARVAQARRLGLRLVAGLLHHGSGPPGFHLLDPDFPAALAAHAGAAATRYPDILDWTPVNEPLTTARFSCLYGVWYPHARDMQSFLRATALQCHATLLCMQAIRARIPGARLVQTEDVGRVFSTAPLAAQARHDTERSWLSLDLLCGRVDRHHPWRARFEESGVPPRMLDELAEGGARPDVAGANYYATSDRFLDHRTAHYPPSLRGSNGQEFYADTEAARVRMPAGTIGWLPRLRELWARYEIPIAITEAHLGGSDEADQLRWFMEAWEAARTLQAEGGEVLAVTAWAMVGSVDWDSLMRETRGRHESGVWDMSAAGARPRLVATALRDLIAEGRHDHPGLAEPGWWRREDRFHPHRRFA